MATCRDVSALLSRALDERLGWPERLRVRLHLLVCDACRQFAGQVQLLRAASRQLASRALAPRPDGEPPA